MRALALAPLLLIAGCALPYLAHVSKGQGRILIGRESIESRLERDDVSAGEKAKLRLVLDVRRFAHETLGLELNGSFTQVFDTGDEPAAWNLSACADDAFEPYTWSFPIVGTIPYKGYFDGSLAHADGEELRARDKDILIYTPAAYSTLGWFDDPLFTPMLLEADVDLANTIVHELAHATVFVASDAEFNETLATFVGNQGSLDYFQARGAPADPRLKRAADDAHDEAILTSAIAELRARLDTVYRSTLSRPEKLERKARVIDAFKASFVTEVRPRFLTRDYDGALRHYEINNAWVLAHERYHADLESFLALHRKLGSDLRVTVRKLRELARSDDPRAALAALAR